MTAAKSAGTAGRLGLLPARLGAAPLARMGQTPLVRFDSLTGEWPHIQILGKAEWMNPGGSVKDRAAVNIIATALRRGELGREKRLLDSTSGNTGIAYAMMGAARGIGVTLCVPANVSVERKRILQAYGAEVVWTDAAEGSDGAIRRAQQLYAAAPDKYFYADQYSNDANWLAHYHGTGKEIWEQTQGRVTHFVAGLGTSGTFVGVTRRLKQFAPGICAIALEPDSAFHGLEGLKHMATALVPRIYDPALADRRIAVETEAAYAMARQVARSEGALLGPSAAAALVGASRIARELGERGEPAVIATVLPDSADKYLSEKFWEQ